MTQNCGTSGPALNGTQAMTLSDVGNCGKLGKCPILFKYLSVEPIYLILIKVKWRRSWSFSHELPFTLWFHSFTQEIWVEHTSSVFHAGWRWCRFVVCLVSAYKCPGCWAWIQVLSFILNLTHDHLFDPVLLINASFLHSVSFDLILVDLLQCLF